MRMFSRETNRRLRLLELDRAYSDPAKATEKINQLLLVAGWHQESVHNRKVVRKAQRDLSELLRYIRNDCEDGMRSEIRLTKR